MQGRWRRWAAWDRKRRGKGMGMCYQSSWARESLLCCCWQPQLSGHMWRRKGTYFFFIFRGKGQLSTWDCSLLALGFLLEWKGSDFHWCLYVGRTILVQMISYCVINAKCLLLLVLRADDYIFVWLMFSFHDGRILIFFLSVCVLWNWGL